MAERTSPPREVFGLYFESLKKAIAAPSTLAEKLFAKGLIGTETNTTVINKEAPTITKAVWILEDIQATLEKSRQPDTVLKTLCHVLEDAGEPVLEDIATSMRSALEGKFLSNMYNTDTVWIAFEASNFSKALLLAI